MTRLRQKYKKLKQKYDSLLDAPVKYIISPSKVSPIQLSCQKIVPNEERFLWDQSSADYDAACFLAERALDLEPIERTVDDDPMLGTVVRYRITIVPKN